MKIAITGGIAAGKTTVVKHLMAKFKGACFYSVDGMVATLYQEKWWRDWLLAKFGTADKAEISKLAFARPSVRLELEARSAMHIGIQLGKVMAVDRELTIVEFPLLFEACMQRYFDQVMLVTAPNDVRVERAMARGLSRKQCEAIMLSQWPAAVKAASADFIVDTTQDNHLVRLTSYIGNLLET